MTDQRRDGDGDPGSHEAAQRRSRRQVVEAAVGKRQGLRGLPAGGASAGHPGTITEKDELPTGSILVPRVGAARTARPDAPAMEKIIVHAKFHTGHRQLGYPGECRFVHGHTWRGTVAIATEVFPRDELDMSLDFGHIKKVMRDLDHKMLVVEADATFLNPELFEPEGVVVMKGKGPSVENVAHYVFDHVVDLIRAQYPGRGLAYRVEVTIQETENNFFIVDKTATV